MSADERVIDEQRVTRDDRVVDDRRVTRDNGGQGSVAVIEADEVEDLRDRWIAIQSAFIDEPRRSVAEADRLAVLQSPKGAQRSRVDPADPVAVVRLYEKLLPSLDLKRRQLLGELKKAQQSLAGARDATSRRGA